MNEQDRKLWREQWELLARLEERTANIYHLTEKQEEHLRELNGAVSENTSFRKGISFTMKLVSTIIGALITALVTKAKGLW
uniref:Uncharacterized protein n=1 Tax=viral metagenome TaxID=1070528 RepID=A0A6M3IXP3_9ZZZZ